MDHLCHTPQVCIGFLHLFPSSFCPGCCHRHLTLHIARIAAAARGIGEPQRIGRMPLASPRSGLGRIWSGRSLLHCFLFPGSMPLPSLRPAVLPSPSLLHSIASPAAPLQRLAASSRPPACFSPSPSGTNGRALHTQRGLPFQVGQSLPSQSHAFSFDCCSGASEGVFWQGEKDPQPRSR